MNLEFSDAELAFGSMVRGFIDDHLAPDLKAKVARGAPLAKEDYLAWHRILHRRGWVAPSWPTEHGGPGWTVTERFLFEEECAAADAPTVMPFGVNMVGPIIYTFGTAEQKARFLPRILSGEDWWCQGYSEPGAGSDLAALRTGARRDGDQYVVTGQKTWTSLAHESDMMFCLVRTGGGSKPQEGISFLLVDMASPGITVRPIVTIEGGHHVNDVFLDEVRVPVANLVGEEGKGWTYAKLLLARERSGQAEIARSKRLLERVRTVARREPGAGRSPGDNPIFRHKLASVEIDLLALEYTGLRVLAAEAAGRSGGAEASLLKLKGTELHQSVTELALEAAGYSALAIGDPERPGRDWPPHVGPDYTTHLMSTFLYGRAKSIWGGSNEIQRNIIAKQLLGL